MEFVAENCWWLCLFIIFSSTRNNDSLNLRHIGKHVKNDGKIQVSVVHEHVETKSEGLPRHPFLPRSHSSEDDPLVSRIFFSDNEPNCSSRIA